MHLRETTAANLSEAAVDQGGSVLLRLIAPGWSENGRYYSEALLKRDGLAKFSAGTHTYINHPSASEKVDQPERSVRDLVGSLTENAYYDPNGPVGPGLYARAAVREEYRPLVKDLAEVIGMSIRADGTGHHGEAEGRQGAIIDSIESVDSVDYVTQPAAGGRVVALLESVQDPDREYEPHKADITAEVEKYVEAVRKAGHTDLANKLQEARNVGQWLEARLHIMFTEIADHMYGDGRLSRDERLALSGAIGDALTAFTSRVEGDAGQLFGRDPYDSPEPAPTEVSETSGPSGENTEDPPADEAGQTADPSAPTDVTESTSTKEDAMTDGPGAGTAPQQTPRSLMEAEISNMKRENATLKARDRARGIVGQVLSEGWLVPAQIAPITESLLADVPLTNDLELDETELVKRATVERDKAEQVGYQVSEALGVGRPRDLGYTSQDSTGMPTDPLDSQLEESFRSLGLSESAAKIAAKGR